MTLTAEHLDDLERKAKLNGLRTAPGCFDEHSLDGEYEEVLHLVAVYRAALSAVQDGHVWNVGTGADLIAALRGAP